MKSMLSILLWGAGLLLALSGRAEAAKPVTLDVYATPGAPTFKIKEAVFKNESPKNHHDIWIMQGGANDVFWYGTKTTVMVENYLRSWTAVADLATSCGATVIFQELTPVIPSIIDVWVPKTAPNEPKIKMLNSALAAFAAKRQLRLIKLYDDFKPHWNTSAGSWGLVLKSDSVHPSAEGAKALAKCWVEAIRDDIAARPHSPVRVAIYGDSITATTYLADQERPARQAARLLLQPGAGQTGHPPVKKDGTAERK